jgi:hypothetical protein
MFKEQVDEVVCPYYDGNETPQQMGWVGANGLP